MTIPGARVLPRSTAFGGLLVVVAGFAMYVQYRYIPWDTRVFGLFHNQLDLRVYRAGGSRLLHGRPIYDGTVLGHMEYTYPPFSTVVMSPFALVSKDAAVWAWAALEALAVLWVVWASFRSLGHRRSGMLVLLTVSTAAVASVLEPVRTTVWFGQINLFLMAAILWDLLRGRDSRLRGCAVGLTAGVKLTPAFFVVYLAVTRQWRAAATAVAVGVATVVVGVLVMPRQSWMFWTDKVLDSQRVGAAGNPANQSVRGALARVLDTPDPSTPLWLACCLLAAALGLGAAVLAHRRGHELLALTLTGMTTTAVSPFSWGHHWVWFVPLLVIAIDLVLRAWSDGRRLAATVLVVAPLAVVLDAFIWKYFAPEGVGTLRPFFGIGLFMNPVHPALTWFAAQPYLWAFAVTAVVTIVVCLRPARRPQAAAPAPIDVGARR
ncbi:MAG: glycosyltransferase 87 family protein [Gordonia paraffinivorans]